MKTLDGADRTLDPSMLMITDARGPIAVAGVMGGADSEVSPQTRDILLEAATFDKTSVRRTAQKLKMSHRSELPLHAWDSVAPAGDRRPIAPPSSSPNSAAGASCRAMVDRYPVPQEQVTVYLSPSQVRRTLGLDLSLDEIAKTLSRLEFVVQKRADLPPNAGEGCDRAVRRSEGRRAEMRRAVVSAGRAHPRRSDRRDRPPARVRQHRDDAAGPSRCPAPVRNPVNETEEKIRDILVGCGLQETINYSLTTPEQHEKLGVDDSSKYVTLANSMSVDRTVMRRSMLVSAIENLAYNIRFTNRLATFEIGRVYLPEKSEDNIRPLEDRRVSLLLTGPRREVNLNRRPCRR